jgi:hypothetical protein
MPYNGVTLRARWSRFFATVGESGCMRLSREGAADGRRGRGDNRGTLHIAGTHPVRALGEVP